MNTNRTNSPGNWLLNILTMIVLAGIVTVVAISLIIYFKPFHSINPFPPATMPAAVILWTSTPKMDQLESPSIPTSVVTGVNGLQTPVVISTETAVSTIHTTQQTSASVFAMPVTPSVFTATADYSSMYPYQIQTDPAAISADLFDSNRSNCDWMGVAGQVHDLHDSPVTGILVLLGGSLERKIQNQTTITGTARNYGPAGYEFTLANHLVESNDTVWIQLVDQSYVPLSARVYFDTFADCEKSLVIINFKQVR